ncbi:MAG: UDP-N-acetylmuramate dehydrogenase [Myxococcales bacterium FL481]|nr:MAG: UDP-N-acetylmuramate dehydrogenase [Myxococcales bacterium FL481]
MSRHTTLRLGGPADVWAEPHTVEGLVALLTGCAARSIAVTQVGAGTNLLVRDGGVRGVVVNLRRLNAVERFSDLGPSDGPSATVDAPGGSVRIDVQAGCSTGRLLAAARRWGLGGVEFLAGVPGSVGGGMVMNAGTYLGEFTDVTQSVRSVDRQGRLITRAHAECGFRYRASDLPSTEVVVDATLRLPRRDATAIDADVSQLRQHRRQREPTGVHNNGSTFKNPPGDYAGRLIESAGLKGLRRGGAVVSPVHANWLVVEPTHTPRARASDLLGLIDEVRHRVAETHGVELELEVKVIGESS